MRRLNWIWRGPFACDVTWPNCDEVGVIVGAAYCTRLAAFSSGTAARSASQASQDRGLLRSVVGISGNTLAILRESRREGLSEGDAGYGFVVETTRGRTT